LISRTINSSQTFLRLPTWPALRLNSDNQRVDEYLKDHMLLPNLPLTPPPPNETSHISLLNASFPIRTKTENFSKRPHSFFVSHASQILREKASPVYKLLRYLSQFFLHNHTKGRIVDKAIAVKIIQTSVLPKREIPKKVATVFGNAVTVVIIVK
jgi:hypothetical protein